jgi:hypothetical protein
MHKILIYILLNITISFSQVTVNEINNISDYNIGKNSTLFYDTKYTQISNFTINRNYAVLYSEKKFALYLFDIKSNLILDEIKIEEEIKHVAKKYKQTIEYLQKDKIVSSEEMDCNPVNFHDMQFIDDTTIFAGLIFFKTEINALFLSVNGSNKIDLFLKKIPLFSELKEIPKKNKINAINTLKSQWIQFITINPNKSSIIFQIFDNIKAFTKENYFTKENKMFIYKSDYVKNTTNLLKEKSDLSGHVLNYYRYTNNGINIFEYILDRDSINVLDTNLNYIIGGNIGKELKRNNINSFIYEYFVKNNFTKQVYLCYEKPVPIEDNDFSYDNYLCEIIYNKYDKHISLELVKKILSTGRIEIYEINDNKIFFKYKRSRDKSIYTTTLYNDSISELIKQNKNYSYNYSLEYENIKEQVYVKPNYKKFYSTFGKVKNDKKNYPVNTIKNLLQSYNKCLKEKNIAYVKMYLSAYHSVHLNLIYNDIESNVYAENVLNTLNKTTEKQIDEIIKENNKVISLLNTDRVKEINKELVVINTEINTKYKIYREFVKINNSWCLGYSYKKIIDE